MVESKQTHRLHRAERAEHDVKWLMGYERWTVMEGKHHDTAVDHLGTADVYKCDGYKCVYKDGLISFFDKL